MEEKTVTIALLVLLGVATAFVGYYAWEIVKKDFIRK